MSGGPGRSVAGTRWVVGTWLVLLLGAAFVAIPRVGELGLYYDEAFLAQQARDFVEPGREDQHAGSVRYVDLFGRPFPVRNAAYLGSLKSQLLIPVFGIAGADVATLRIATFATGWLAVLLGMLFVARVVSLPAALLTGLLIASDPSFYFFGQFEWGPFTTNLLCRTGGLWLLAVGWQSPDARRALVAAALGGLALGLGVFSRADFALIVAGLGIGVAIGHGSVLRRTVVERRGVVAAASVALAVGSAPMWLSAASLLGAGGAVADRGDLGFRARVLWHVLDGSQFHRLMQTGGLFEDAARVHAPAGLFGIVLAIALVIVGLDLLERGRKDRDAAATDPRRFLWIATVVILGATLALPGAVRAHHQLNAFPFTQIVVACAIEVIWRRGSARTETMRRVGAVATLLVLVAANVRVTASTVTEIEATGGRGRWTGALAELAVTLEAEPGASAVSLDWGFHEPLLFMTDAVPLEEAIWAIPRALGSGRPWVHAGDASTRYLAHGPPYDLFGLGPLILSFARAQPQGTVEIEIHRDRAGNVAFHAIRFLRPHRLRYTGRFALD